MGEKKKHFKPATNLISRVLLVSDRGARINSHSRPEGLVSACHLGV